MMPEADGLTKLYREDFGMFAYRFLQERAGSRELQWSWVHDLMCDRLMRLVQGEIQRLIINIQPRSLKSEICSVALPAWLLLRKPSEHVVGISYEESLANALARGTREIMQMPMYVAIGGPKLSAVQYAAAEFETNQGGKRLARSVGGAVTGRGGDYLIFDDLAPAEHATSETGRTKLNERIGTTLMSRGNSLTEARILVVAQRLHEDDATGRFLREGGWEHLSIPAIATGDEVFEYDTFAGPQVHRRKAGEVLIPERDTIEVYDRLKRSMSPVDFEAQYQQNPIPAAGNLVSMHWFPRYSDLPGKFEQVIMACDTASKVEETNDYSALVTFGRIREVAWVIDVFRAKLEYPDLKAEVRNRSRRFDADIVLIEDAGSGTSLLADLRREGMYHVRDVMARQHKEFRFRGATGMMSEGRIYLPANEMWLEPFEHELKSFPVGQNDDMVDAFVHGIEWMKANPTRSNVERFYSGEFQIRGRPLQIMITVQNLSKTYQNFIDVNGRAYVTDEDGVITLPEEHARPLLMSGWTELGRTDPRNQS